ncbi:hypothetical protein HUG10_02580 [Halorarum halophilum]|uniref:Uncharacterized protein n=1 Tax=Halorarum halophilum TaxID=2743090 RepID=A0A7D5GAD4_9EURY|nr:hypothetical protein [Halobaculum halophilum]QLG26492.1 hypothetical protein HUG10_02580 [Halobaculum halophilum]
MAHLRGADRGQLMLVGALALAVLFVSFAFLLNAAIYTETIASRGTGVEADTVVGYRNAAVDATGGTIDRLSAGENRSYDSLHGNLTTAVGDWDRGTARQYAIEGDAPSVEVVSVTNGTRVVQNGTRNFTDADGAANWTLAEDVRTRNYTMTVEGNDLAQSSQSDVLNGNTDGAFNFTFENASGNYSIYVYESGGEVELRAEDPDGNDVGSCTRSSGQVEVDFTAGTVDGADCDALDFYRALEGSYELRYANADHVSGTYATTVDAEHDELVGGHYAAYGGDGPFRSTAIYAVDIEVVLRSASVYYRNEGTVAPGAPKVRP